MAARNYSLYVDIRPELESEDFIFSLQPEHKNLYINMTSKFCSKILEEFDSIQLKLVFIFTVMFLTMLLVIANIIITTFNYVINHQLHYFTTHSTETSIINNR